MAAAAALVLLLGACSEPGGSAGARPDAALRPGARRAPDQRDRRARARPSPTRPTRSTRPAKRKGRLWSADILVQWDKPLDDDLVEQIEELKGVAHTERIGLGQVSLENRVLTVAAVDPAGYRHFTQAEVADLQEAWDRVAGGEMATTEKVARRLVDEDGMITLGSDDDAPAPARRGVHPPDPDHRHGRQHRLGRRHRDGHRQRPADLDRRHRPPPRIRKPLERLVGKDASVQMLDVASRLGLDPDAKLTAVPTGGTLGSVVGTFRYRVIGGGRIAPDPAWVAANIRTEVGADPRQRHLPHGPLPAAARRAARGAAARAGRRDPPRRVRRVLLPALHRRHDHAVQPLLRPRPRPQRRRATSAAPSARSTATWWRSSRRGASPGAATGAAPTRCTSSSPR